VTVTRNDVADRIAERGTVISFLGGEQVYIVVNEQPEEILNRSYSRQKFKLRRYCPAGSVSAAKKLSSAFCAALYLYSGAHSSMISECFHGSIVYETS
jgi:hypothetical protein